MKSSAYGSTRKFPSEELQNNTDISALHRNFQLFQAKSSKMTQIFLLCTGIFNFSK